MVATKSSNGSSDHRSGNRVLKYDVHHETRGCLILDKDHVCRLVVKVAMGGPRR